MSLSPPRRSDLSALWAALAAITFLQGCVVVPRTMTTYDARCQVESRKMVLDTAVIGQFAKCENEGCSGQLAALGLLTAASFVVSGSVVVVGNAVYWLERQGACLVASEN